MNKNLFLLLFLFLSSMIHCMKREASNISESSLVQLSSAKPKTIQELKQIRDTFIASKIESNFTNADLLLFQKYWAKHLPTVILLEKTRIGKTEFSPVTLLTMALISHENPDPVAFAEKKIYVQKFLDNKYMPTQQDKEFALLEKWERCESTIKKICLISCAHKHDENSLFNVVLRELIDFITLLTFEIEPSLL